MVRGRKCSCYFYHVPHPHTQPLVQVKVPVTDGGAASKVCLVFSGCENEDEAGS